jgi:hypothetical protein
MEKRELVMSDMSLFCSVCNFSLDYRHDFSYYNKYKCCRHCAMKWAESQYDKWNQGWRPTTEEIDKYKQDRVALALHAKRK